jgi:hypothetical protein
MVAMAGSKRKGFYRSILIVLALIVIAVLVIAVLAFRRKTNVVVDMNITATMISFHVEESTQGMERLVGSTRAASIVLTNFKEIEIWPDRLLCDGENVPVEGKVLVVPRRGALTPRVRFRGEGMRLTELALESGCGVRLLYKPERPGSVQINVKDKQSGGQISLGDSFTLLIEQCEIINREGNVLIGTDDNTVQRTIEIIPSLVKTSSFVSNESKVFKVVLEEPEEGFTLFSNASIHGVNFNDLDELEPESTVKGGEVKFKSIGKESILPEPGSFILIPERDVVRVVKLGLKAIKPEVISNDSGLEITLSGSIDSLRSGRSEVPVEQLPSLLEWLASDKRLHITIGILTWLIAQTVAIRSLIHRDKGVEALK